MAHIKWELNCDGGSRALIKGGGFIGFTSFFTLALIDKETVSESYGEYYYQATENIMEAWARL